MYKRLFLGKAELASAAVCRSVQELAQALRFRRIDPEKVHGVSWARSRPSHSECSGREGVHFEILLLTRLNESCVDNF